MKRHVIPEGEWTRFIDRFSREHAGEPVTIRLQGRQFGPADLAKDLPLQGISFDTQGTRPSSIEVSAGDSPGQHVRHVIDLPFRIRLAEDADGNDIALQIEPAQGPKALVLLR